MIKKIVPITLLTGYLGSGKTTLLNNILNNTKGYKVAVIVNDIGEVNIDEEMIKSNEGKGAETVIPLSNGCICCTLRKDMVHQIRELLLTEKYDHILMEASGISNPAPISNAVSNMECARMDNIITVVDALRLSDEFCCGKKLVNTFDKTQKEARDKGYTLANHDDDIGRLLVQQIEFCTTVIINKIDTVTKEQLENVKIAVKYLQPDAKFYETKFAKIELSKILDTKLFDFDSVYKSAGWIHAMQKSAAEKSEREEYGISTFVFEQKKPLKRHLFDAWSKQIPSSIIRCKGFVWFNDAMERSYIFEQAGKERMTREFGRWTDNEAMIKLVFIGININRVKIETELAQCS